MAEGRTEKEAASIRQPGSLSYQQRVLRFEKESVGIARDKNTKMKISTKWSDRRLDATDRRILNKFRIKHRETKKYAIHTGVVSRM